jgi:hypothetical protein
MRTYSSFCGTVCSDSTGTVTSDAAVRLHRRYQIKNAFLSIIYHNFTHSLNCKSIL